MCLSPLLPIRNFVSLPRSAMGWSVVAGFLGYTPCILFLMAKALPECPPQFDNQIMAQVYVRSITLSTMYQKAPFC